MNHFAWLALGAYLLTVAFTYFLKFKNLNHLKKHGTEIPAGFEEQIDAELLKKTMAYTIEYSQFGFVTSIFSNILILIFIFGGILDAYNSWVISWHWSFIFTGIVFFLLLSYVHTFLSIPFDLYATFHIENKYGFNTQTPRLWVADFFKSIVLSTILFVIVGGGVFGLIQISPKWWWLFVWGFIFIFSIFMNYISPYVIEPLFNKYEPVKIEGLEEKIKALLKKAGIKVSRVFQMDASKRSKYVNAYFGGIGKTKRIVLYDTLLEKMNQDEILAVLAHEAGHWKKKHVLKSLVALELFSLISIFIAFQILQSDWIYEIFGITAPNLLVGFILISFIGGILSFPFSPITSYLSRRREYQADRLAAEFMGGAQYLITALIKLSKDNLSNLHPHPWYAAFYYSHPPVVERINHLRKL